MTTTCPPAVYEVKVSGHLDDHWVDWLGADRLTRNDDITTTLTLAAADQAKLHGLLGRIRDIGVALLALDRVHDTRVDEPAEKESE